jgi:predicted DNA-binding protein
MANVPSEPRPARPAPTAKQIGIRIPLDLIDRLEAIARRENNGLSAVVRRLLTAAIDHSDEAA